MLALIAVQALLLGQDATPEPATDATQVPVHTVMSSIADEIIRRADAGDQFENVTGQLGDREDVGLVRHKGSGLTCSFEGDEDDFVWVSPQVSADFPRGSDVACGMRILGDSHTVYATRYPTDNLAETDLQTAVSVIRQRWPTAVRLEEDLPIVSRKGGSEIIGAGFTVKIDGTDSQTLVLVTRIGDWNFKYRATGPADGELVANRKDILPLVAGMNFLDSLPGGSEPDESSRDRISEP